MKLSFNDFEKWAILMTIKKKADAAVNKAFLSSAVKIQDYAKKNAPWRDYTGRARRTLTGCAEFEFMGEKKLSIIGCMHYSPRLELDFGGRYSILFPTILNNASEVLKETAEAVGGITI